MTKLISLSVKCPHCKTSLMDEIVQLNGKPSIKLDIEVSKGKGNINLCSTFGCFDKTASVQLIDQEIATLSCPHCGQNLAGTNKCDICDAPIVDFMLDEGGKVHVCSRIGCKKHYVSFEDIYSTLSKFYDHYDYGAGNKDF